MNTNHAETFANAVNNIISLYEDLSDNESRNKVISQFVNGLCLVHWTISLFLALF